MKLRFASYIVSFLSLSIVNYTAMSQPSPTVNHIALYVFNLKKSVDFYKNVMQLEIIPDPFNDGKHVWLKIGEHTQLHLIEGAKEVLPHDISSHMAFRVPDLQSFIHHLKKAAVQYQNFYGEADKAQSRPDGVQQVYFQDPDNYWIEVNDDKY